MTDVSDICISIEGNSHRILCGECNRPIAYVAKSDGDPTNAGCVHCSNIAEIQEVADLAVEYAKDELQLRLNRHARDTARKSKIMSFKGQTEHNKRHRFTVDL